MKMDVAAYLIFLLLVNGACPQVFRLSENLYSDGMVLQMEPKRAHIWGYGISGSRIEVTINGGESIATTFVENNAKWVAKLPPQPPGGPHLIIVEHIPLAKQEAKDVTVLRDVMFGDVWVCAGEGNMDLAMRHIFNGTQEMQIALNYTKVYLMHVMPHVSTVELDEIQELKLPWGPITPERVGDFPALCLLYGERMFDTLPEHPIGLVALTVQDSTIEAWVSKQVTDECQTPPTPNRMDHTANNAVWNGMVNALTNIAIRGVIWSQGESNVNYNLPLYACHLFYLTRSWKESFSDGYVTANGWAFPFGIIQAGTMEYEEDENVSLLRYHQTLDTQVAPNNLANETFLAPTYDLHDATSPFGSVYFRDKLTVANRLSNAARRLIYNDTTLHFMGPSPSIVWNPTTSIMNASYYIDVRILNGVNEPSGFSVSNSVHNENISTCETTKYEFHEDMASRPHLDIVTSLEYVDNLPRTQHEAELQLVRRAEDVAKMMEIEGNQSEKMKQSKGRYLSFEKYMNYTEIIQYLHEVETTNPNTTTLINVTTSYEGREVAALKISSGTSMKAIWVDCGVHAREWISPPVCLKVIEEVIASLELQKLADWYILPLSNPDGYDFTWTVFRFWRKTRSPNAGSNCIGTDPNRNFDFMWNANNNSDTCSETYPGSQPFSEAECNGIGQLVKSLGQNNTLKLYLTIHSYGQIFYYPYGTQSEPAPHAAEMQICGDIGAAAIRAVRGTVYQVFSESNPSNFIYGAMDDYAYDKGTIPYSYTIELPAGGSSGFDPPPSQILPVVTETWAGIEAMVRHVMNNE